MQGQMIALHLEDNPIDEQGFQWIEVMPTATKVVNGPWKFSITREDLVAYADSIKEQADRLSIDFDHKAQTGDTIAAAWFTGEAKVEDTDSGPKLMARVQWTPKGRASVESREYRFISPEWQMERKDREGWWTGAKRFVAATLTNRPFFKELVPVADDKDPAGEPGTTEEGDDHMPLKALAASLGLPETATEEEILTAAAAAKEAADKAAELETENATLKAAAEETKDVDLEKLQADAQAGVDAKEELRITKRDNAIANAIKERKADPAEKESLEAIADLEGGMEKLEKLLAARKPGKLGAIGSEGDVEEGATLVAAGGSHSSLSGSRVPETIVISGSEYPVDQEGAKIHTAALEILEKDGKRLNHTADEYEAACLVAADKAGIQL